jgi:hypothetical protein
LLLDDAERLKMLIAKDEVETLQTKRYRFFLALVIRTFEFAAQGLGMLDNQMNTEILGNLDQKSLLDLWSLSHLF